jgi:hypothetical protein
MKRAATSKSATGFASYSTRFTLTECKIGLKERGVFRANKEEL